MKRIIALLLIVAMFAACAPAAAPDQAAEPAETESPKSQEETARFPSFSTENLNGEAVTDQVFADKSITMINIWGTYCGPCINEMPSLQKLNSQLPDTAQIIGIVVDVSTEDKGNLPSAQDIADKAGVTYDSLILNRELAYALGGVQYIPTTFFVDSEGRLVGHTIVGAQVEKYVSELESLLDGWHYEG